MFIPDCPKISRPRLKLDRFQIVCWTFLKWKYIWPWLLSNENKSSVSSLCPHVFEYPIFIYAWVQFFADFSYFQPCWLYFFIQNCSRKELNLVSCGCNGGKKLPRYWPMIKSDKYWFLIISFLYHKSYQKSVPSKKCLIMIIQ